MEMNVEYYKKMSFDTMELTYEVLDQHQFPHLNSRAKMDASQEATREHIRNLGYVKGDGSYDGIIMIYNIARVGDHNFSGGVANVNGDDPFMWLSYALYDLDLGESIDYGVLRHEFGHNVGHGHHRTMAHYRRGLSAYDGFDMMSGGNGFEVSHLHVASKWFFGWVPTSTVVTLQPEGSTAWCPDCLSGGTFRIVAFDDYNSPPRDGHDVAGIHIPVYGQGNKLWGYWLQYRSGCKGRLAGGLSVHLGWFTLGSTFGAVWDQRNFDVYGDTDTTEDSVILPGTCYVIEPSLLLADERGLAAEQSARQVIPRVCVESLAEGWDITASVSFLDKSYLEPGGGVHRSLQCRAGGARHVESVAPTSPLLYRLEGAGVGGDVSVSLCPDANTATAYFYDR